MAEDRLCQRCHLRKDEWFADPGFLCTPCCDEWWMWRVLVVNSFIPGSVRARYY